MNYEKSINSFEIKKDSLPYYFLANFFFIIFNNILTLLLCKINVFDIFNIDVFFQIFFYILKYGHSDLIKFLADIYYLRGLNLKFFFIKYEPIIRYQLPSPKMLDAVEKI